MRLLAIGAVLLTVFVGQLTYYREGLMERVYQNRLAWGHVQPCPRCIGQIAVLDRAHLGKHAYITRPGHAAEGPYLIVDVAAEKDRERLRARGLVGEVDHATAARFGMLGGPLAGVRVFVMESHR